ncbi:MAG TPA: citrate synthase, partial [Thermoanaerobaculia bacterium]
MSPTRQIVEEPTPAAPAATGTARLALAARELELPVVVGSEGETGIDISHLRAATGAVTLDNGYGNTGACESAITFIDGELGILRYRGYPIEEIAGHAEFVEICHLLIYGHLPARAELDDLRARLAAETRVSAGMKELIGRYSRQTHPMASIASLVTLLSTDYPEKDDGDRNMIRLLAQAKTIAAYIHKLRAGEPFVDPEGSRSYVGNFLYTMFARPGEPYAVSPVLERALNLLLILHADHEQNCSTSTVRMVGSSQANLFASISAGISALWGPLHGGANQAVIEMLGRIRDDHGDYKKYVDMAKDKASGFKLMGFGHRVYKNFDPRARILKQTTDEVLRELGVRDPLLDIAKHLEAAALQDAFFVERKLYPNVDFYSGIIMRALGIPVNMFTVIFAI